MYPLRRETSQRRWMWKCVYYSSRGVSSVQYKLCFFPEEWSQWFDLRYGASAVRRLFLCLCGNITSWMFQLNLCFLDIRKIRFFWILCNICRYRRIMLMYRHISVTMKRRTAVMIVLVFLICWFCQWTTWHTREAWPPFCIRDWPLLWRTNINYIHPENWHGT